MKISSKVAGVVLAAMIFCWAQTADADAFETPGSLIGDSNPEVIQIWWVRGNPNALDLRPQPGFNATLLMNQPAHFDWFDNLNGRFVIKDAAGEVVFTRALDDGGFDLVPANIGLKTGEKYSWSVDNGTNTYRFTIIDAQTERELFDALSELEEDKSLSSDERIIKKALYVQRLSDKESALDLYWLSVQWLNEISSTDKDISDKKYALFTRYIKHLNDEMNW